MEIIKGHAVSKVSGIGERLAISSPAGGGHVMIGEGREG
jgi:hypothetical protein